MEKKTAKSGLDYVRGSNWEPMQKTVRGWMQYAKRNNSMRKYGFSAVVVDCGEYFRINYGRKA